MSRLQTRVVGWATKLEKGATPYCFFRPIGNQNIVIIYSAESWEMLFFHTIENKEQKKFRKFKLNIEKFLLHWKWFQIFRRNLLNSTGILCPLIKDYNYNFTMAGKRTCVGGNLFTSLFRNRPSWWASSGNEILWRRQGFTALISS